MRIRWWQSIRFRLALGSLLLVLLATTLLALAVTLSIIYYYGVDQRDRLANFATNRAQSITTNYADNYSAVNNNTKLKVAATNVFAGEQVVSSQGEEYVILILDHHNNGINPSQTVIKRNVLLNGLITVLHNSSSRPPSDTSSLGKIYQAVLLGQNGIATVGEIGQSRPGAAIRTQ